MSSAERRRILLGVVAVARADADAAAERDDGAEWHRLCELADRVYADAGGTVAAWREMYEWLGGEG